MELCSQH